LKPFHAVANLALHGLPAGVGRPNLEDEFATEAEAVTWLRANGGGCISAHRGGDFRVIAEIPPG